jgi:hypothetical protein
VSTDGERRPHWRWKRRKHRRDENYIWQFHFPPHIESHCRASHPGMDDRQWGLIEQGLREWFLCCAWRDGEILGMPSKLVDEAWHEFILDSRAYHEFCEGAFGEYLHHSPEETMATSMGEALGQTVRAWDRSPAGGEAVLWGLDHLFGIAHPQGLSEAQVEAIRAEAGGSADAGTHHHGGAEPGGFGSSGSEAGGEASSGEGSEAGEGGGDSGGDPGGGDSGGGDSGGGDSGGGCGGGDSGGGGCGGGGCGGGN